MSAFCLHGFHRDLSLPVLAALTDLLVLFPELHLPVVFLLLQGNDPFVKVAYYLFQASCRFGTTNWHLISAKLLIRRGIMPTVRTPVCDGMHIWQAIKIAIINVKLKYSKTSLYRPFAGANSSGPFSEVVDSQNAENIRYF